MNFTNLKNPILLRSTRPADENADGLTIGPRDIVCDVHSGTLESMHSLDLQCKYIRGRKKIVRFTGRKGKIRSKQVRSLADNLSDTESEQTAEESS